MSSTNFSLTFVPVLATATVSDSTILGDNFTKNLSANYATLKSACKYYHEFTDKMTEAKFREFFGTTTTRSTYLASIATQLDKTVAGPSLLASYNADNNLTNAPEKMEVIDYTVSLTSGTNNFDTVLNRVGIAAAEWSSGGKFQLIFNFTVGSGTAVGSAAKNYTVGVEWPMAN
jgi:hypothetical protein